LNIITANMCTSLIAWLSTEDLEATLEEKMHSLDAFSKIINAFWL